MGDLHSNPCLGGVVVRAHMMELSNQLAQCSGRCSLCTMHTTLTQEVSPQFDVYHVFITLDTGEKRRFAQKIHG